MQLSDPTNKEDSNLMAINCRKDLTVMRLEESLHVFMEIKKKQRKLLRKYKARVVVYRNK